MTTKETIIREAVKEFDSRFKNLHEHFTPDAQDGITHEAHEEVQSWLTSTLNKVYDAAREEKEKEMMDLLYQYLSGNKNNSTANTPPNTN